MAHKLDSSDAEVVEALISVKCLNCENTTNIDEQNHNFICAFCGALNFSFKDVDPELIKILRGESSDS